MTEPKSKYAPVPAGQTLPPPSPIEEENIDNIFPPTGQTPFDPPQTQTALLPTNHGTDSGLVLTTDDNKALENLVFAGVDILDALQEAEVGPAMGSSYHEFNTPGEKLRAIFNGMTTISKMGKDGMQILDSVCFQTATNVFLNSGANLVDQCRQLKPGTPIQITYVGEVSTKQGNDFKKFEVNLLRMPAGKQSDITAFWTQVNSMGMSKEEGQKILSDNGGNFSEALKVLSPGDIAQA